MEHETVLLGVFVKSQTVPRNVVKAAVELFDVKKVFVFRLGASDSDEFLVTFNVTKDERDHGLKELKTKFNNVVQFHRNRAFNVLYTINSLNAIISLQTGQKDSQHKVNWEDYKNSCLVLSGSEELKVLPTLLYDIIEFQ